MTVILAKIFGLYFFAIGFAFLINRDRLKKMYQQIVRDQNFLLLAGILALLIGAVVVSLHNQWVFGWPLVITLLGWWSLIKGFALLIYPESIKIFSFIQNRSDIFYLIVSLIYLIIGLFLLYKGWQSIGFHP